MDPGMTCDIKDPALAQQGHDRIEWALEEMIDDIESEVAITRHLIGRDHLAPRVMDAMREVPRVAFVPPELQEVAFEDGPLPIGHGQTISGTGNRGVIGDRPRF